ncbi:hypothetical protein FZEAL_2942 [Fusarium zealandicum]|uniref:Uncharacterized protein n=1 Tax=Fusarium zealandicum TaxID=1053134 RepID=A0A8H4XMY6_9HYPO|nr:hypothetical protein FZEAL_2942 [Fusarium zealandicum]
MRSGVLLRLNHPFNQPLSNTIKYSTAAPFLACNTASGDESLPEFESEELKPVPKLSVELLAGQKHGNGLSTSSLPEETRNLETSSDKEVSFAAQKKLASFQALKGFYWVTTGIYFPDAEVRSVSVDDDGEFDLSPL